MLFIPIYDFHVPMDTFSRAGKCTPYETPIIKERWQNHKERTKDKAIEFTPMDLNGDLDPYKPVESYEHELERVRRQAGKELFGLCFTLTEFERKFHEVARTTNPWQEAKLKRDQVEAAEQKAREAAATAEHVDLALRMRREDDVQRAALPPRPAAPKPLPATADDDTDEIDVSDLAASVAGGPATGIAKPPKAHKPPTKGA